MEVYVGSFVFAVTEYPFCERTGMVYVPSVAVVTEVLDEYDVPFADQVVLLPLLVETVAAEIGKVSVPFTVPVTVDIGRMMFCVTSPEIVKF